MATAALQSSPETWQTARRFPRVPLVIPVEVCAPGTAAIVRSQNVSMGGMLLDWQRLPLPVGTEVRVLFNLATGHSISCVAEVMHVGGTAIGIRFRELGDPARMALSRFLRRVITYTRRGARLTRRMHVTIRRIDSPESAFELAETIVVSRHGGLLSTRAHFAPDEQIFLWWADGKRGTNARIANRRHSGTAGLMELGFEFMQDFNFWGIDFPDEECDQAAPQLPANAVTQESVADAGLNYG